MKKKQIPGIVLVAAVWLALAVLAWVSPAKDFSQAERRKLAQMPKLTGETVLSGSFMTKFEEYTQDQFPFREGFRGLRAAFHLGILRQGDKDGIYVSRGSLAKLEYPLSDSALRRGMNKFQEIYDTCLKESTRKIVFSVVPDKGYYLAPSSGRPAMDYDALFSTYGAIPWAEYVDLTDCLDWDSFYRTDTHWRQECLLPVAEKLCAALGAETTETSPRVGSEEFYGVYAGQMALPVEPDCLTLMENATISQCVVNNLDTGTQGPVYDLEKLWGRDPYEVFLSGSVSLLTVENPSADADRKLVIFRDSFGSSLAPLLLESYRRVTLIDLRYLPSGRLAEYVDFSNADVLFLYSTLVLNHSEMLK